MDVSIVPVRVRKGSHRNSFFIPFVLWIRVRFRTYDSKWSVHTRAFDYGTEYTAGGLRLTGESNALTKRTANQLAASGGSMCVPRNREILLQEYALPSPMFLNVFDTSATV